MPRFDQFPEFATRLSYRRQTTSRGGLFLGLARLSLMGVTASMSSGCLIKDPPPYTQPKQTPPRLDLVAALPSPDQLIVRNTGDTIAFNVPVVSEDAGDRLEAWLQLDVGTPDEDLITTANVPPSTLDDTSRAFTLSYTVEENLASGCHRFTLRVSHELNFTSGTNVLDPKDVAEVYWWANIDPENSTTLVNCPLASSGGM